jgi:hypothetical protein
MLAVAFVASHFRTIRAHLIALISPLLFCHRRFTSASKSRYHKFVNRLHRHGQHVAAIQSK